jgi:hypothetical protein
MQLLAVRLSCSHSHLSPLIAAVISKTNQWPSFLDVTKPGLGSAVTDRAEAVFCIPLDCSTADNYINLLMDSA